MARKKVTLDNLGSEIEKILAEYEGEVQENLDEITKKIGKKGALALKNESLAKFRIQKSIRCVMEIPGRPQQKRPGFTPR